MSNKKTVQVYYSRRARDYDRQKSRTWGSELGFRKEIIDEIVEALSQINSGFILEIGVGSGRMALPVIRKTMSQFVGLDLSREMLRIAKGKTSSYKRKLSLILGDAERLPFRNHVFDAIICMSTLHYFMFPRQVLGNFSKALKKNGVLVYGDVTMHEQDQEGFLDMLERTISYAHAKYCRPSEAKRWIENCGIQVSKMKVIPYKKTYNALIEDKARYFDVDPQVLYETMRKASERERRLYNLEDDQLTLFYTLIVGTKQE
jgi:ubiquinone/menaquinone biosynthesis C-methylase UbiE